MKRSKVLVVVLLGTLCLACSGSSGSGGSPADPVPSANFTAASSQDALKSNDLTTIANTHCKAYTADPTSSTAAFGCAVAKLAQLLDSNTSVDDFMVAIGEPSLSGKVQAAILGPTNPNSLCFKMATDTQYIGNYSNIPFNSWGTLPGVWNNYNTSNFEWHTVRTYMVHKILLSLKQKGVTPAQLQSDLYAIDSTLGEIVAMLAVAKDDVNFTFAVPVNFCNLMNAHSLTRMDATGLYVLTSTLKIAANALHGYTIGLDFTKFVVDSTVKDPITGISYQKIDHAAFVKDANGGDDGKKFAELVTGQGDLSGQKTQLLNTLNSLVTLIDTVKTKEDSVFFGRTLTSNYYKKSFQKIENTAKDLIASIQQNTLTAMTNMNKPNIKIDVNKGLSQLPDPKFVSSSDPFVIDGKTTSTNNIRAVADFFKSLLTGIASF